MNIGDIIKHKVSNRKMIIIDRRSNKLTNELVEKEYSCRWFNEEDGVFMTDDFSEFELEEIQTSLNG